MLPVSCQMMLKEAALSKDIERIQRVTDLIRILSPDSFLQDEQDMKSRVFYHRPFGVHWSGDYRVDKII